MYHNMWWRFQASYCDDMFFQYVTVQQPSELCHLVWLTADICVQKKKLSTYCVFESEQNCVSVHFFSLFVQIKRGRHLDSPQIFQHTESPIGCRATNIKKTLQKSELQSPLTPNLCPARPPCSFVSTAPGPERGDGAAAGPVRAQTFNGVSASWTVVNSRILSQQHRICSSFQPTIKCSSLLWEQCVKVLPEDYGALNQQCFKVLLDSSLQLYVKP